MSDDSALIDTVLATPQLALDAHSDVSSAAGEEALTTDHELLVAAAPVLAVLAVTRPQQCLARALAVLVRGARVTASNDMRDKPHPAVLLALERIAQSCSVGAIASVLSHGNNGALLRDVAEAEALCSAWRERSCQLVDTGVLTEKSRSAGVRLSKSKAKADLQPLLDDSDCASSSNSNNTRAPSKTSAAARRFKLASRADAAVQTLLADAQPYDEAVAALDSSEPLRAIRVLQQLRQSDAEAFATRGQPLLVSRALPMLARVALPTAHSDGSFADSALSDANLQRYTAVLEEVRALFPVHADQVLQVSFGGVFLFVCFWSARWQRIRLRLVV